MTPTDRARVLLELVEDCLRAGKRDVAVEQLEKALREHTREALREVLEEYAYCRDEPQGAIVLNELEYRVSKLE